MNRNTFWVISLSFILLSAALLKAAIVHDQWRGFYVSEFHLILCALGVFFLLRPSSYK